MYHIRSNKEVFNNIMYDPLSAMTNLLTLTVIAKGDTYGYELQKALAKYHDYSSSEIYAVLDRMKKCRKIESYSKSINGRCRKYYRITDTGKREIEKFRQSLPELIEIINAVTIGS